MTLCRLVAVIAALALAAAASAEHSSADIVDAAEIVSLNPVEELGDAVGRRAGGLSTSGSFVVGGGGNTAGNDEEDEDEEGDVGEPITVTSQLQADKRALQARKQALQKGLNTIATLAAGGKLSKSDSSLVLQKIAKIAGVTSLHTNLEDFGEATSSKQEEKGVVKAAKDASAKANGAAKAASAASTNDPGANARCTNAKGNLDCGKVDCPDQITGKGFALSTGGKFVCKPWTDAAAVDMKMHCNHNAAQKETVCTKAGIGHVHMTTQHWGMLMIKRMVCKGAKCDVFKVGMCLDTGLKCKDGSSTPKGCFTWPQNDRGDVDPRVEAIRFAQVASALLTSGKAKPCDLNNPDCPASRCNGNPRNGIMSTIAMF